jgi:hypothetical protein
VLARVSCCRARARLCGAAVLRLHVEDVHHELLQVVLQLVRVVVAC